jgi:hypothetical protein
MRVAWTARMANDDYDTPRKEVIMQHFPEFMAFYFPSAHAAIDWFGLENSRLSRSSEMRPICPPVRRIVSRVHRQ